MISEEMFDKNFDLPEFLALMVEIGHTLPAPGTEKKELRKAFKQADGDNDGYLTPDDATASSADAPASDPASWRNWTPVSPYLAKDPRPDLSQGMSLKAVEEIEARAQEAQKYALEAESLSQQAQQASQEALAAIERKDRETVTEKCKEAERLAAEAKEVEEKCKAAYDACKKAREDARAMADAGDAEE